MAYSQKSVESGVVRTSDISNAGLVTFKDRKGNEQTVFQASVRGFHREFENGGHVINVTLSIADLASMLKDATAQKQATVRLNVGAVQMAVAAAKPAAPSAPIQG